MPILKIPITVAVWQYGTYGTCLNLISLHLCNVETGTEDEVHIDWYGFLGVLGHCCHPHCRHVKICLDFFTVTGSCC